MSLTARLCNLPSISNCHQHDHHQLVVGVRGDAEFEINGKGQRVSPVWGCLAPAETAHYYQGNDSNDMVIIDLLPTALSFDHNHTELEIFHRLFDDARFFPIDDPLQQLLRFSASELNRSQQDPLLQRHISATILHSLHGRICADRPLKKQPAGRIDLSVIDQYIGDHLNHKISVHHLAALCHLSSSHFHSLFKQQTGLSPHRYLLQARLRGAGMLLQNTELSLAEISQLTGFSSQSALSHALRKHLDITPGQLRARSRDAH